jgi:hypothetical protein
MHLMPSRLQISWHRTSATSAVGSVVPAESGAVLSAMAVDGDWYLLPGTVSAELPHRFSDAADRVTFLCFRRPKGVTDVPDIRLNGEPRS